MVLQPDWYIMSVTHRMRYIGGGNHRVYSMFILTHNKLAWDLQQTLNSIEFPMFENFLDDLLVNNLKNFTSSPYIYSMTKKQLMQTVPLELKQYVVSVLGEEESLTFVLCELEDNFN
jgi:hypothetical protein